MRMSCNGCRVLRKGCSEDCSIRPCLQWIKNPESQGHATVFLAKFYGRAGLLNLINAGPDHLRPGIFRSLLYEACGRMVNPTYGSVGLLWSGNWPLCQAAVDAVLKGAPVIQMPSEMAASIPMPPLKSFDIRHVPKDDGAASRDLHKVAKTTRTRFKRPGTTTSSSHGSMYQQRRQRATSHESTTSHEWGPASSVAAAAADRESREIESGMSMEIGEASMGTGHEEQKTDGVELELSLSLGSGTTTPSGEARRRMSPPKRCDIAAVGGRAADACRVDLALDLTA